MAEPAKRLAAIVRGHVQGVGFRAFVGREARRLRLRGYVWNLEEGAVEVVAEGPEQDLLKLLRALSRGPLGAHVTRVEAGWPEVTGEFDGFRVRY